MLSSPVKWSNPTIILVPSEFFPTCHPRCTENSQAPCRSVINGGEPEGYVRTSAGKGHELGVELQTDNGACVFAIQYSYFYTTLSIPAWILPSSEQIIINWESGVNETSLLLA